MSRKKTHLSRRLTKKKNAKQKARLAVEQIPLVGEKHSGEKHSGDEVCTEIVPDKSVFESSTATTSALSPKKNKHSGVIVSINYRCEICHLIFTSEYNLRQHLDYYGDPRYECKECGIKLTDERQLQFHSANAHGTVNSTFKIKCSTCTQMFDRSAHFRAHLYHYHEHWTESIENAEKLLACLTEIDSAETEHLHLIRNGVNCREHLERRMKTQRLTRSETQLQNPQVSAKNASSTKCVDKVTTENENPVVRMNGEKSRNPISQLKSRLAARRRKRTVRLGAEKEFDLQNRLGDNGDKLHELPRINGAMSPATKMDVRLPTVKITRLDPVKLVDMCRKCPVEPCAVTNENDIPSTNKIADTPEKKNGNLETNEEEKLYDIASSDPGSSDCGTEAPSLDGPYIDAPSADGPYIDAPSVDGPSTDAPSADSAQKLRRVNVGEYLDGLRDYDEEVKQRKLFSCKDCYVPLVRLNNLERLTKAASAETNLSKPLITQSNTVIPSIICDKIFESEETMLQHYQQKHLNCPDNEVHCVCGKKMEATETLQDHFYQYCRKSIVSSGISLNSSDPCKPLAKKLACAGCGEKFWLESCLSSHVKGCEAFAGRESRKILTRAKTKSHARNHVCGVCRTSFNTQERLLQHERKYSRVATLRCTFCATMFSTDRQLVRHMKVTHLFNTTPDYICVCRICSQPFKRTKLERIHRMHVHRDWAHSDDDREPAPNHNHAESGDPEVGAASVNECNVCNLVFSSERRLIEHTIYYKKNEIVRCDKCYKRFNGQYTAHHHKKKFHYSADTWIAFTYWCKVCTEGFLFMDHLRAHMFHVHIDELKITAQHGSKSLNNRPANRWLGQLRNRNVVTVPIRYACRVCNVALRNLASMEVHRTKYANDNRYSCDRCSEKLADQAALNEHHALIHSNDEIEYGVKCRLCDQTFSSQSHWVSHVKHFHEAEDPSEFYLEENMSIEESGINGYDSIPTNESISSGLAYSKIKKSIERSKSLAGKESNERGRKEHSVIDINSLDVVILENDESVTNSEGPATLTSFNGHTDPPGIEMSGTNIQIIDCRGNVTEEESPVVTTTVNVPVLREEQSSSDIRDQAVNASLDKATSEINTDDAKNKKATLMIGGIRQGPKSIQNFGYNCGICNCGFYDANLLAKHMAQYSDGGRHMCEICGRRFDDFTLYCKHRLNHRYSENFKYFCKLCDEGFDTPEDMRIHTAHVHPESLEKLPSTSVVNNSAQNRESSANKNVPESRSVARLRPYRRISDLSDSVPTDHLKVSTPILRTYSRQCNNPPEKQVTEGNAAVSELVETVGSPRLHPEIFKSMRYGCPDCHANYSTLPQLDEHIRTAHGSSGNENNLDEPLAGSDVYSTCNVCDKVFANEKFMIMHKERRHSIKPVEVLTNSAPKEVVSPLIASANAEKPVIRRILNGAAKKSNGSQPGLWTATLIHNEADAIVQLEAPTVDDVRIISRAENDAQPSRPALNATQLKCPNFSILRRVRLKQNTGLQNRPKVVKRKPPFRPQPRPERPQNELTRIGSGYIAKRLILETSLPPPTTSSSAVLTEPTEIAKVQAGADLTGTVQTKLQSRYVCSRCNIIFMTESHLIDHEERAHLPQDLPSDSVSNTTTEAVYEASPINEICNLVGTLPSQPENVDYMEAPLDFESVLIPVSRDDLERFEDENPINTDVEEVIDPPDNSTEKNLPPDNFSTTRLKVRSFAEIVKNLSTEHARKKNQQELKEVTARMRSKFVFNREVYEELCSQHNLEPNMDYCEIE